MRRRRNADASPADVTAPIETTDAVAALDTPETVNASSQTSDVARSEAADAELSTPVPSTGENREAPKRRRTAARRKSDATIATTENDVARDATALPEATPDKLTSNVNLSEPEPVVTSEGDESDVPKRRTTTRRRKSATPEPETLPVEPVTALEPPKTEPEPTTPRRSTTRRRKTAEPSGEVNNTLFLADTQTEGAGNAQPEGVATVPTIVDIVDSLPQSELTITGERSPVVESEPGVATAPASPSSPVEEPTPEETPVLVAPVEAETTEPETEAVAPVGESEGIVREATAQRSPEEESPVEVTELATPVTPVEVTELATPVTPVEVTEPATPVTQETELVRSEEAAVVSSVLSPPVVEEPVALDVTVQTAPENRSEKEPVSESPFALTTPLPTAIVDVEPSVALTLTEPILSAPVSPDTLSSTGNLSETESELAVAESPVAEARTPRRNAPRTSPTQPVEPSQRIPEAKSPVPQRVRGLRRVPVTRTTTPAVGNQPVIPPRPVVEPVPSSAAPPATKEVPRRVRGLRRAVTRPGYAPGVEVPQPVPATAQPIVTAEPLPNVYKPLPAEVLARLPESRIVPRNNWPELVIAGEARVPMFFFVYTEDEEARDVAIRQIRLAYEAGVRIFTVLAHLPWKGRSGERRYEPLDEALQLVVDNAPEAFLLPRLIFSPTSTWSKQNPDEMTRYADGEQGDVSLASRAFWEGEAEEALRAAVEHVAQGTHASRVFGFYLEHGEWFYEKGRGYDQSEANKRGFREWLRTRYKNNLVALRAAWYDSSVHFDTVEIPSYLPPANGTGTTPLFYSRREQRYRDYHEYASDIVAQVILRLGKAVKEASGNRSLVAVSYGYTLELSRASSGHLSLAQILQSPFVDILTGPISYTSRTPGGVAPLPVPLDSIRLAGKLWISEDDTKTHLSGDDTPDIYNPRIEDATGTSAVHIRNFGAALTGGAGISYMDLWGQGWLNDRDMWRQLGRLREVAETLKEERKNRQPSELRSKSREGSKQQAPDVAVIVDERVFFDVRSDEALLGKLVTQQRETFLRSGARVGFYLLSDLTRPDFPTSVKLLLFLNAFRLPDAVRNVIRERFQSEGRTLAWVYGPGCLEENLSELTDVIGMQVRLQPWGSKIGTQVLSNVRSPLTDALRGQRVGDEVRCNPSFYVADTKAQVLGEYVTTGNPSLAHRKHPLWQSVFIGETTLPLPLLRGLYKLAGVPIFTSDDDVAWIGDQLICLHSAPGGGTTVYLPENAVIADVLARETLATGGYGARISMPPRGTRLLFYGTAEEAARFGVDVRAGQPGLTEGEIPRPTTFTYDTTEPQTSDISAGDEALFVAALSEVPTTAGGRSLPAVVDKDEDEDDEDEELEAGTDDSLDEAGRKRRRRRRRRGRRDEDMEAGEESGETVAGEITGERVRQREMVPFADAEELTSHASSGATRGARSRPSLDELLPLSESPMESNNLPPIPDEFLPMESDALSNEDATDETEETGGRRRRGRFSRRSRVLTLQTTQATLQSQDRLVRGETEVPGVGAGIRDGNPPDAATAEELTSNVNSSEETTIPVAMEPGTFTIETTTFSVQTLPDTTEQSGSQKTESGDAPKSEDAMPPETANATDTVTTDAEELTSNVNSSDRKETPASPVTPSTTAGENQSAAPQSPFSIYDLFDLT